MLHIEEVILGPRQQGNMAMLLVEQFLDFALDTADYYYVVDTGTVMAHGSIEEFTHDVAQMYLAV